MNFRVLAIVFIVALPVFFYVFVNSGKHRYKYLQYFGPKIPVSDSTKADTIYHAVADFYLLDVNGNAVSFEQLNPSYWVFSFFNTQCTKPCLNVIANLQEEIQRNFKEVDKVKIISVTTHPATDSLLLKKFERDNGITSDKWLLCYGDSLATDSLMQKSFFIKTGTNIALENVYLVDTDKHIRGIYDGTSVMEMRRLKDEIKVLSYEYKQKQEKRK